MKALPLLCLALSCGYRPVHSQGRPASLSVSMVSAPDMAVATSLSEGVKLSLLRHGALRASGYPRVEVELLRLDETSAGIASVNENPRARGTSLGLVARARIVAEPGTLPVQDTGDVRVVETLGVGDSATSDQTRRGDFLRVLARRLGEKLGLMLLGYPSVRDERLDGMP